MSVSLPHHCSCTFHGLLFAFLCQSPLVLVCLLLLHTSQSGCLSHIFAVLFWMPNICDAHVLPQYLHLCMGLFFFLFFLFVSILGVACVTTTLLFLLYHINFSAFFSYVMPSNQMFDISVLAIDIDHLPSSVCTLLPFLPWDCLLPICSTYTKHSTQEVLQPLNTVARVKYWILPSVCDSFFFIHTHRPLSSVTLSQRKIQGKRQASLGISIKIYAPVKGSFYLYVRHIATICITLIMGLPTWNYMQCTYPLPHLLFHLCWILLS